jgi:hypothetical protein
MKKLLLIAILCFILIIPALSMAFLGMSFFYALLTQFETKIQDQMNLHSISTILEARIRLYKNSSPNLTMESLFLDLRNV